MSEALRRNIPTATGEYTNEDVDVLTAALHTPPPATSPSPTTAVHDRRFITLVGPPPALQPPSTQAPSTTPSPSTTTPRAHLSSTSQSRAAQQPDATGTSRLSNQSTSSAATETAVQSATSSIQPSQSPDKQPDSAPTPVSASGGLSRGAEAGIVIGSIALVVVLLGAVMIYYYKRKPLSKNNIFTSRNKNLVPQRTISRPFPLDMSSVNPMRQAPSVMPRPPPAVPALSAAGRSYAPSDRPLPPIPSRQSRIGRSSSSYSRLP
ncbi:hypothetical protein MY10362_004336 [Beauveria mimosiformis]